MPRTDPEKLKQLQDEAAKQIKSHLLSNKVTIQYVARSLGIGPSYSDGFCNYILNGQVLASIVESDDKLNKLIEKWVRQTEYYYQAKEWEELIPAIYNGSLLDAEFTNK